MTGNQQPEVWLKHQAVGRGLVRRRRDRKANRDMTDYMARALELAAMARGSTGNNPAVGAVVVRDGRIAGEGFTLPPGQPHAEVVALGQVGKLARGASLFVTLEPCCHHGRTPPCTAALIAAGVREVHIATLDPNPLVSGGGKAALEAAGIRTCVGEREVEARRGMEAWLTYITHGRPMITAKYAMSLDGKIAAVSGDSKWISGERARQVVQRLRADAGAIMVGVNTVLADDPQLTARDAGGQPLPRQPLRVVVDTSARTPPESQVAGSRLPGRTLIVVGSRAAPEKVARLEALGNVVVRVPEVDGRVSLEAALHNLAGEWEVTSALVEGGGTLLGTLFDLGVVDKVVAFVAPKILGGREAPGPVMGRGAQAMAGAVKLREVAWEPVGDDLMLTGYVDRPDEGR